MNPYLEKYLKITLNILLWVFGIAVLVFFLPKVALLFMPFIIGWIIALMANPIIKFLEKKLHIIRKHGSAILIMIVLAFLIFLIYLIVSKLMSEAIGFSMAFPDLYKNILEDLTVIQSNLKEIYKLFPQIIQENIVKFSGNIASAIPDNIKHLGEGTLVAAGSFAKNIPSIFISVIITIMSAYFMLVEKEKISDLFNKIITEEQSKKIHYYLGGSKEIVGGYFKAQFKIMIVVSIILLIGFLVLGIKYSLLLAVLIAFLDFLPFFGTGTVLIPWAIVKLFSADYKVALGLTIIYVISQVVRHLIQPKILADTIGLSPLLTLIFLYTGYKLGGVIGMILSVPVGMVVIHLFRRGFFDNIISIFCEILKDIKRYKKF